MVACIDVFHVPGERSGAVASPRCTRAAAPAFGRVLAPEARQSAGFPGRRAFASIIRHHASISAQVRYLSEEAAGQRSSSTCPNLRRFLDRLRIAGPLRHQPIVVCDHRRFPLSLVGERRNQICLSMALTSLSNKVAVVSSQSAAALSRACLAECRNLARARSMAEM